MELLVGRQPIFDTEQNVYAYELLFRGGFSEVLDDMDEHATNDVIHNALFAIGLDQLTSHKLAFINFSRSFLLEGIPELLPKKKVVVEILEHVEPDDEVVQKCKELKDKGYTLALDDFVFTSEAFYNLFPYIDIIKLDWSVSDHKTRKELIHKLDKYSIEYLAEKVETEAEYDEAKELGCIYFQGYFFKKPEIIKGKEISLNHGSQMEIIKELNENIFDFNALENVIKKDPSLSFKILKLVNSASLGVKNQITSIKQAMVLIGEDDLKKWINLLFLRDMSHHKPTELLMTSIIRARFCELLSKHSRLKNRSSECFFLGMFSLLDVILGVDINNIIKSLPLQQDIKDALINKENELNYLLHIVIAYENSNWDELNQMISKTQFTEHDAADSYRSAIVWAEGIDI
jgi:c-di-GMP-related signal transduction protein